MQQLTIRAHAKINLALDALNRRPDGYHTVRMIMQSLALCDTLTLKKNNEHGITLYSKNADQYPDVTWDENNLIYKAAKLFLETFPQDGGVHIAIEKQIPSSAGLAGGSSNAAATLLGMNQLFEQNASIEELHELAVKLGADVPYCLRLGTALAEGIGQDLTPLAPAPALYCTLVKPAQGISTPVVYDNLNLKTAKHPDIDTTIKAIETGSISGLCSNLNNILEPAAIKLCPEIKDIKAQLLELGALGASMTGSGPTVFALFDARDSAAKAAEYFTDRGYTEVFVTKLYQP